MKKIALIASLIQITYFLSAQGQLSGDFMLNANFYDRDTTIGANTSQYQHELSSADAWLFLNYKVSGFTFSTRFDLYNNSPLLNPSEVYTDQGLGYYSVHKAIGNLEVTAGHFYDQFGSGIIFRAYEDRILGLDYAVQGIHLRYNFSDNFRIKAFTGKQKNRFKTHPQVMKGVNIEKDFNINDKVVLYSGIGLLNRTIDQETMTELANVISSYPFDDQFYPKYNNYAVSIYNSLNYKNINWYIEYAYKTEEAINSKLADKYISSDGKVFYSSLNYSRKGFGLSFQYKKNETFSLRSSPFNELLVGTMNYLPPMCKQNAKTLPARYSVSAKDFGEQAIQADLTISPNKTNTISANFSYIMDENDELMFREVNIDHYRKWNKNFKSTIGIQSVLYDQLVYENHGETVKTITPFSEFVYKISKTKSIRTELQYLFTKQDHGDFFFGLLEYNIAPHWSVSVSDMVNTKPRILNEIKHYYNISAVYTLNQTRFQIGYMKQVEGIVCTGGICRLEPAFSGVKFNLTTSF